MSFLPIRIRMEKGCKFSRGPLTRRKGRPSRDSYLDAIAWPRKCERSSALAMTLKDSGFPTTSVWGSLSQNAMRWIPLMNVRAVRLNSDGLLQCFLLQVVVFRGPRFRGSLFPDTIELHCICGIPIREPKGPPGRIGREQWTPARGHTEIGCCLER